MHRTDKFVALIKCRNQLHIWKLIEIMSEPHEIETSKQAIATQNFNWTNHKGFGHVSELKTLKVSSLFLLFWWRHCSAYCGTSPTLSSVARICVHSFPLEKEASRYDQVHASVCILIKNLIPVCDEVSGQSSMKRITGRWKSKCVRVFVNRLWLRIIIWIYFKLKAKVRTWFCFWSLLILLLLLLSALLTICSSYRCIDGRKHKTKKAIFIIRNMVLVSV